MTGKALVNGLLAGAAGVAAMTLSEKVEQLLAGGYGVYSVQTLMTEGSKLESGRARTWLR